MPMSRAWTVRAAVDQCVIGRHGTSPSRACRVRADVDQWAVGRRGTFPSRPPSVVLSAMVDENQTTVAVARVPAIEAGGTPVELAAAGSGWATVACSDCARSVCAGGCDCKHVQSDASSVRSETVRSSGALMRPGTHWIFSHIDLWKSA